MYRTILSQLSRTFFSNTPKITLENLRQFKTSNVSFEFFEKDDKGGYVTKTKLPSRTQMIREGLKELKHEIALWSNEMKERFEFDPYMVYRAGETDVAWRFSTEEDLKKWIVTCDSDHNEGYSSCSLDRNQYSKAVFSGELSTRVPKDGLIKRSGYCNIKSIRATKSFKRNSFHDWTPYNMLVLKVRGDGRSYMLNIMCKGFFDLTWNDTFHYVLYTRGGPHWQIAKIPFSKFFFASKGRIQDRQNPIALQRVTSFGISMGDKINGPFCLEIDYIGLEFNPNHTEEFAYEMYKMDKYIVAT